MTKQAPSCMVEIWNNATKRDSWGLRWTNTVSYDFNFLPKQHRLNILLGHEVTDSGGSKVSISASHFPSNFTKDNAFAMINQYDAEHGTSKFSSGVIFWTYSLILWSC